MERVDILQKGDAGGNGMVVKFRLPSGLEICGLPTKNFYGGHWDLGPTWNYVVRADKTFLVDSGRFGQGANLLRMMDTAGIRPGDLEFVLISHGHEDHDGGLGELVKSTSLLVKAHPVYERLARRHPAQAPRGHKELFPAKCWHCFMPEWFFSKYCLRYHEVLQSLEVEGIENGNLGPQVQAHHLPGHSPDCLAVQLGEEAILVGDIVLPGITPWPTREAMYEAVGGVLGPDYPDPQALFGLRRYIRSLKKLRAMSLLHPDLRVLPAHRLYFNDRWNGFSLGERVDELINHHISRCGDILRILSSGPRTADEIAECHFDPGLLEGFGRPMALNEVVSHCELLVHCGDVGLDEGGRYFSTGSSTFESYIEGL